MAEQKRSTKVRKQTTIIPATTAPSIKTPVVHGYIETFEHGKLHGWVYDTARPDESLAIQIYTGDILLAEGVADVEREDLREAGLGNGEHGFVLKLDIKSLEVDTSYPLRIVLMDGAEVAINPFELIVTASDTNKQSSENAMIDGSIYPDATSGLFGNIDEFGQNGILGWVINMSQPTASLTVTAYINEKPVGSGITYAYRPDISDLLQIPVNCGFLLKWDEYGLH